MRIGCLLLCGLALSLEAQQDPARLLLQVSDRVRDSIRRLPRYMCTQTIDRQRYEPPSPKQRFKCDESIPAGELRLVSSDRLRLDVGVTGAGEIYAWAGAKQFEDRKLSELVTEGSTSTGTFASFLIAIFGDQDASFTYEGDVTEKGRVLSKFGFRVPVEISRYVFTTGTAHVTTAYAGEIFVDPKSSDLIRLEVHTTGLAPETGACQATTVLDYSRVQLEGGDFLLPAVTNLDVRSLNGTKSDNRTVFANCHEFLGESTVSFDPPPDPAAAVPAEKPAKAAATLPPGLRFSVSTTQDIDPAVAAAGDAVQMKLTGAIIGRTKEVIAPSGAIVAGRLMRVRRYYAGMPSVSIGIKLETIEIDGVAVPLHATPNFPLRTYTTAPGGRAPVVELGTLDHMEDPEVTFFQFRNTGPKELIGHGLPSNWVISDAAAPISIKNILLPDGGK
jgi:hypothetical protein